MTDEHAELDGHADEVKKHLKLYIGVFVALLVLTVVTVAVTKLAVGFVLAVVIAMIIATVKGSLVAAFFMHLAWEKRMIYLLLLLSGVFLVFMVAMFVWSVDATLSGTAKPPIEAAVTSASEGH